MDKSCLRMIAVMSVLGFSGPLSAQAPPPKSDATAGAASAAPAGSAVEVPASIGFSELEGYTIEASSDQVRRVRSDLGMGDQKVHHSMRIAFGPQGSIQHTHAITITRVQRGDTETRTHRSASQLGVPHTWRDGKAVWVFENDTLTLLLTMADGAHVTDYRITRKGDGFGCENKGGFAREEGGGGLASTSTHFGAKKVEFLNQKTVSRSCRVRKG